MKTMIFVNLPVADLARSERFYEALGFKKVEEFSNADGTGMKFTDEIWVMLLTYDFYRKFIGGKSIPDLHSYSQALISLTANSKEEVDDVAAKAVANGGTLFPRVIIEGAEDMYTQDFADPDGHIWEFGYMPMPM